MIAVFIFTDGLPKVLEITQKILTDGSLKYDFRGRAECRSFVLNENNSNQIDLFGSANIEAWLHLQFTNKVRSDSSVFSEESYFRNSVRD